MEQEKRSKTPLSSFCKKCNKEFNREKNAQKYCKDCSPSYKEKRCGDCGILIWNVSKKCRQCANKELIGKRGKQGRNWKGGIKKDKNGYLYEMSLNHPFCDKNGYVLQHRLIMEKYLGRYLTPEEQVHHLDFNPSNNNIINLHLFKNNAEHLKYHRFLRSLLIEELRGDFKCKHLKMIAVA